MFKTSLTLPDLLLIETQPNHTAFRSICSRATVLSNSCHKDFSRDHHRADTEGQWPLSGVHSIMMEKPAQPGVGGWCTPSPFHYVNLPSRAKLWCTLSLRRQIHSAFSPLPLYVLCGSYISLLLFITLLYGLIGQTIEVYLGVHSIYSVPVISRMSSLCHYSFSSPLCQL